MTTHKQTKSITNQFQFLDRSETENATKELTDLKQILSKASDIMETEYSSNNVFRNVWKNRIVFEFIRELKSTTFNKEREKVKWAIQPAKSLARLQAFLESKS